MKSRKYKHGRAVCKRHLRDLILDLPNSKFEEDVHDCAMDRALGFPEDKETYRRTFCDHIEDSISGNSSDQGMCRTAQRCKAVGLIDGTGSGFQAC